MSDLIRVAGIQMDPKLGRAEANLAEIAAAYRRVVREGADIAVFPECALQGIVYHDPRDAYEQSEDRDGPHLAGLRDLSVESGALLVVGFLERVGDRYANSALVAFPSGDYYVYRKTHLTELGADRWAVPGACLSDVLEFRGLKFGVGICYDIRFPEPTRALALQGVDALLLPTNSPEQYEGLYDHGARTRAWENRIWVIVANRIGVEDDTAFVGRSMSVDPFGSVVSQLPGRDPGVTRVDIDVQAARVKSLPGHQSHQYDMFSGRRPDLYAPLAYPPDGTKRPVVVHVHEDEPERQRPSGVTSRG